MSTGPFDDLDACLAPDVLGVVRRASPIPTISKRAAAAQAANPKLVRADIGQIVGMNEDEEVLYGPPAGLDSLRAALAETWLLTYGLSSGAVEQLPEGLRAEHISITTGAAEGLSLLFRCFALGKTVGLPLGHWENYDNGVELAGGRTTMLQFFDEKGHLDFAGLDRAVKDQGIELLVCNFPSNPTGAVLEDTEYRELAAFLREHDLIVIADEVYNRLRYDAKPPRTLLAYAPERTVVVSSASKEYLIPGARVGFAISAYPELSNVVLPKLVRGSTGSPNVLGQQRLLAYLEAGLLDLRAGREPQMMLDIRAEMARRRAALLSVLSAQGFGLCGRPDHEPQGTIFLVAKLPAWWRGDDVAFADQALESGLFSCIPGSAFGIPGAVRFSFGAMTSQAITTLAKALSRMH
ncbi:MAG: pyridoxal phosphate-dependent aminotransferase [Planctomycetota bacterium]